VQSSPLPSRQKQGEKTFDKADERIITTLSSEVPSLANVPPLIMSCYKEDALASVAISGSKLSRTFFLGLSCGSGSPG
jgi:hypothetical protein